MKKLIWTLLMLGFVLHTQGQDILGQWNGLLEIPGAKLRVVFNLSETDGKLIATMDSPDQGATDIPTDEASFTDNTLSITANKLKMSYTGSLEADGRITGTFSQGSLSVPMDLSRAEVDKPAPLNRPQEPKTFPYKQEEVKFKNSKGGHELAGTLTMPKRGKFNKVAILISGSGPQNRNEELLGHKPFLVLSDHLTRQGIAVLRYDDRGTAESGGDFSTATSKDFADDAAAAVAYLRKRKDMKGKEIGLIGHSEGGMIAPMVASQDGKLDFIVLLAGPGINIRELLLLQMEAIGKAEGAPETARKANAKLLDASYKYIQDHPEMDKSELKAGVMAIMKAGLKDFPEEIVESIEDIDAFVENEASELMTDWFIYFTRFNPADFLNQVECPVLAINGGIDLQVTPKENLEGIRQSLSHNSQVTIKEFPGLNHLFQQSETGAPSEYGEIEETFNEEALKFVSDWILAYHKK